jgi:hypothetical protein
VDPHVAYPGLDGPDPTTQAPASIRTPASCWDPELLPEPLPELAELLPEPLSEPLPEVLPELLSELLPEALPELPTELLTELLAEPLVRLLLADDAPPPSDVDASEPPPLERVDPPHAAARNAKGRATSKPLVPMDVIWLLMMLAPVPDVVDGSW